MAERRLKRIEDLVVRGVHTVENDEHRVCHKPEICDCKCAVCVAAKLPHPQDHAEPWTGRTDLSHAQQDERREMLEAAVTDGLRVVSVMIQRGVPLELVTEEFRKISSKFPEFTVEAVKADAESTPDPVDRELKELPPRVRPAHHVLGRILRDDSRNVLRSDGAAGQGNLMTRLQKNTNAALHREVELYLEFYAICGNRPEVPPATATKVERILRYTIGGQAR